MKQAMVLLSLSVTVFLWGCGEDETQTPTPTKTQIPSEPQFILIPSDVGFLENARIRVDASRLGETYGEIEVRWDWGDGQHTIHSSNLVSEHIYTSIGEYPITLAVRSRDSMTVIVEQKQTVTVVLKQEIVSEIDGATMRLIPAGEFEMGDHFSEGKSNELPVHTVVLDAFYMDVTEVTNAMYKRFVKATGYREPFLWRWGNNSPNHPVMSVDWHDAMAYAQWASKRLPTEAQWEYAARGGLVGNRYPLGNEISHNDANYVGVGGVDRWNKLAPVGSFSPNSYGLFDMSGNVWEWCLDKYNKGFYAQSPKAEPLSGDSLAFGYQQFARVSGLRVWRGGGWDGGKESVRVSNRLGVDWRWNLDKCGFRCVSPLNSESSKENR